MTDLSVHLRIVGVTLWALCLAHLLFPRRFGWKDELGRLSLLNRQIFLVHVFFICLTLAMMGTLALVFPAALLERTRLARSVLAGLTIFWATRLVFQWLVYDRALWRGHRFNTAMHIVFTVLWSYYTVIFAAALRRQYGQ
jgi:hypothetical protein